jgi:hypothetical protein
MFFKPAFQRKEAMQERFGGCYLRGRLSCIAASRHNSIF